MDAAQPARILSESPVRYPVPAERHRTETVVERSRFICTIDRVESPRESQQFIREMQSEFPDATHNCWAYVAGAPGSTSHIGLSDDGEPHGTAGRPMFTVLLHSGIGELAAVVTRYYGGVKLGTGGLARAYGGAVQHALATLAVKQRVDTVSLQFGVDYGSITAVRQLLETLDASTVAESYAELVSYEIDLARDMEDSLRAQLADITRGKAVVTRTDTALGDT